MIIDHWKLFCHRPSMFGIQSSEDLECAINGYYLPFHIYNIPLHIEDKKMISFSSFVQKHYTIYSIDKWGRIIRLFCENNEDSISKSNELLTEFLAKPQPFTSDHYNKIISAINKVGSFKEMLNQVLIKKDVYQINSTIELSSFLVGVELAINDLGDQVTDKSFEEYKRTKFTEFPQFIGKKYDIQPITNAFLMLLSISVPLSKSLEYFAECYNEFYS